MGLTASSPIVLEGENLTMRFGGLVAMAEVAFTLKRGEILGIIGPNGAGKSTLLNIITGIYIPSSGEVRLEGERLNGVPAHKIVARGIARTFQSSRLFGDLSVLDNVIIGRHTHTKAGVFDAIFRRGRAKAELDAAAAHAETLLKSVSRGLHEQRHRPAGELAQADRRRLEIARALATDPKVLLLDEPSSGMDDADTDALMDDIRAVCAQRPDLALMIIEHDMRLVASLPHRVMVLDYGQKLADGPYEEIRRIPRVQEAYLGRKAAQHAGA
ncbi:Lipopolysaccharide export system ATP-binding protein LptB [Starkeya nomas]|uniref:Lipopolysaccharide export system ATP-binding protein LptB n=1 Tax=Starkeya nomas TaxID=2666134 RepID=A0A5S9P7Y9_9HYPH|nr:ABC transporter ATP-binding protein [Starkeya nomas]CAA0099506.1 Lipopolysaccharide export system ATP-binding protein LptB [Starkeya nomas]